MEPLILLGLIIFFLLITAVIVAFSFEGKTKQKFLSSLSMSLFLVMMPKRETGKEGNQPADQGKNLIAQMEQVFANFIYLNDPGKNKNVSPCIAFEIASQIGNTDISFYVAVPRFLESALEKYIQGVYPNALVEKVPQDYNIFEPGGAAVASYLRLSQNPLFPINTYLNLEKDPLS